MTSYDPKDKSRLRLTYILPTGRHKCAVHMNDLFDLEARALEFADYVRTALPDNGVITSADYTLPNTNEFFPVQFSPVSGSGGYTFGADQPSFEGLQYIGKGIGGGKFALYLLGIPQQETTTARVLLTGGGYWITLWNWLSTTTWVRTVAGNNPVLKGYVNQISNKKLKRLARR